MLKKTLIRASIGFFLGIVIGNVISLIMSGVDHMAADKLLSMTGGSVGAAYVIQNLLFGLLGALSFGGTALYDSDLNLVAATVFHLLLILCAYFPIAYFLGWFEFRAVNVLIMAGIMTAVFFIIWLIMYLICKKQTKELNELQEEYRRKNSEKNAE